MKKLIFLLLFPICLFSCSEETDSFSNEIISKSDTTAISEISIDASKAGISVYWSDFGCGSYTANLVVSGPLFYKNIYMAHRLGTFISGDINDGEYAISIACSCGNVFHSAAKKFRVEVDGPSEEIPRQCDHTDFFHNLIIGNGNHTLHSDFNNQTNLVLRLYLYSGNYIIEVIDEYTNYKRSYERQAESNSSFTEIPFDDFFDPVSLYPVGKYVTVNIYKPNCENSTSHPCTHFATAKHIIVRDLNSGWHKGFDFHLEQKK